MKKVVHFYDILMVQLIQNIELSFLRHLLLNIIETSDFHCKRMFLFIVVFLVANKDGGVHTLSYHFALFVELRKLTFALLLLTQLVKLFGTVLYES